MSATMATVLPWMHAIGWTLLHSLWQGALIGAVYAAIRHLVPQANAGVRYVSGLIALAFLAIVPMATLWLLRPVSMGVEGSSVSAAASEIATSAPHIAGAVSSVDGVFGVLPVLVLLWLVGVVVSSIKALREWQGLERIVLRHSQDDAELTRLLDEVSIWFGRFSNVRVLVSSHIDTPTLIGWLKPVILLPSAVALGFPRHQLELILAHELGHLRRHDHLVNLAQVVVETLLFYHPVVHWISREVRHEREICCDRLVLSVSERKPSDYARTLAALESVRQVPVQLAVAATGGLLVDRVRRILGMQSSSPQRFGFMRLTLAIAALVCLLGISLQFDRTDVESDSVDVMAVSRPSLRDYAEPKLVVARLPDVEFSAFPDIDDADVPAIVVAETAPDAVSEPRSEVASVNVQPTTSENIVTSAASAALITPATKGSPDARQSENSGEAVASVSAASATPAYLEQPEKVKETVAKASPRKAMPVLINRVAPVYPTANLSRSKGHVEFAFSIDPRGRVRDIEVVSGDSSGAFADAARRALTQWRFEPQADTGSRRFQQDFVFVDRPYADADLEDGRCTRTTGTRICRPIRGSDIPRASDESFAHVDAGQR
jgi:bla regulator protein BlaR1